MEGVWHSETKLPREDELGLLIILVVRGILAVPSRIRRISPMVGRRSGRILVQRSAICAQSVTCLLSKTPLSRESTNSEGLSAFASIWMVEKSCALPVTHYNTRFSMKLVELVTMAGELTSQLYPTQTIQLLIRLRLCSPIKGLQRGFTKKEYPELFKRLSTNALFFSGSM